MTTPDICTNWPLIEVEGWKVYDVDGIGHHEYERDGIIVSIQRNTPEDDFVLCKFKCKASQMPCIFDLLHTLAEKIQRRILLDPKSGTILREDA